MGAPCSVAPMEPRPYAPPDFEPGWSRLAELLALDGKENEARAARERASQILASHDGGGGV